MFIPTLKRQQKVRSIEERKKEEELGSTKKKLTRPEALHVNWFLFNFKTQNLKCDRFSLEFWAFKKSDKLKQTLKKLVK